VLAQTGCAQGHLVWNTQPDGGWAGLGGSPRNTTRLRRKAALRLGAAESNAMV
jgi:hypothetical protein